MSAARGELGGSEPGWLGLADGSSWPQREAPGHIATSATRGGDGAEPAVPDPERRVLHRYARRELPVTLQSTAYTWSQLCGCRRLYARTRQERPGGLLED